MLTASRIDVTRKYFLNLAVHPPINKTDPRAEFKICPLSHTGAKAALPLCLKGLDGAKASGKWDKSRAKRVKSCLNTHIYLFPQ